ncbi:TMV resistance protein N-like [Neltuma alba]|uniref:TMV resistance protein N-like n=1 Tax=Neltuma alba TaxID=207710 RepID=UPI0010A37CAE|nr:TMV resistance protein N-like [Prosopis alba]
MDGTYSIGIWGVPELDMVHDVKMGASQMKEALSNKSVLVVFDDVNHIDQLIALCGSRDLCFGKRSLVLVTSTSKDLILGLGLYFYEMKALDESESLELFSWHAFKKSSPTDDFMSLSGKAINFCEGLPLALEVIGSLLLNRTKKEWNNVLKKLRGIPRGQIKEKLKISLNFLTDSEKDLFYNIASFYVGLNKHDVTQLLKGSKSPVEKAMHEIIERGLVKVDMSDKLDVHHLLREIGREISPKKIKHEYIYDVFLSFRGEDTRKSFTTHLCTALKKAGIEVFMDEEGIGRGEAISSSLLQAIESSRMSIIIFSKNYAGSSWCLQELEKIMECHKTTHQEVLPIFYDVQPSEVRKLQNIFGEAWKRLTLRNSTSKVKKSMINWKRALIEAANISGWDMHECRTETELIDDVVETITMKLDSKDLFVAHHPVGVEPRVQDIIKLLINKSNEVIIAGIWGMGGIGKTTIAKAIFNEIGQTFEGKCFLSNVREVWKQDNGQVYLQKQILSSIFNARRVKLTSIEMGTTLIKQMLCKKRVLIVLDDVNNDDQLKALCGNHEWFGRGSRILITTRDERLLKILGVEDHKIYNMKEMNDSESLELFSWHAFKQRFPERDYVEFSRRIVSYSGGLPLALEVLGSYLFDREALIWESVLQKLQKIPNDKIHEKLKISYDGLSDQTERDIFLDICCFFIGKDKSYATQILNGCGLHADIGIIRLVERSLIKVGKKNKLDMHDLLRDMGRHIIREQSPEDPEKQSRLWSHDDVLDVLRNCTGTIAIKGLALNMSTNNLGPLSAKAFENMKKLRLLQLDHVQLTGDFGYLSKDLRWLCWNGFPLENLPANLSLEKIVAIDLKWSNLTKVWEKSQRLEWLKILNLSHCHHLTKTPDFSKLPYLEKLILKDCPLVFSIHPSIGDLKYIVLLNLKDCKDLNHLPRGIYNLKSLKTLNLSGCSKIEKLKEDIGQMESLTTLVANQTSITQVPSSLVRMKSIKFVSLCGFEGLSRDVFPSIVMSWMSPTVHSKSLLRAFTIMPSLIKGLSHPLFARSRKVLEARPSTSQDSCRTQGLIGFQEKSHMERLEPLSSLTIHLGGFNKVMDALLNSISQGWSDGGFDYSQLPQDNYPDWLCFESEGSSASFKTPRVLGCLMGMVIYIIYSSSQDSMASVYPVGFMIKNFTKGTMDFYKRDDAATSADDDWHKIILNLEPDNEVEITVNFAQKHIVKKTLIYLV